MTYRKQTPTDPVVKAWQAQLTESSQNPWLASQFVRHGNKLFARFAMHYNMLRNMPRKARFRLKRKLGASLGSIALMLSMSGTPIVLAANATGHSTTSGGSIYVTTTDLTINSGDGYCSLPEAIITANDNVSGNPYSGDCNSGNLSGTDTIVLDGNTYSTAYGNHYSYGNNALPPITSAITIEGNEAIIQRIDAAPPTAQNGAAEGAGNNFRLISVTSSGDLTLNSVSLENGNLGNKYGPANTQRSGGGGSYSQSGGAILNTGQLTLNDVNIEDSYAYNDGGGLMNAGGGSASISYSYFGNNRAGGDGGAIANRGQGTNNKYGAQGGGGTPSSLTVHYAAFISNYANDHGGGIANFDSAEATLSNIYTFYNYAGGHGGGIANFYSAEANISNAYAKYNTADRNGGAFANFIGGDATLTNVDFQHNHAQQNGRGLANFYSASLTVSQSNISNNGQKYGPVSRSTSLGGAYGLGGGIANFYGGDLTVSATTIENNRAYRNGGGIANYEAVASISTSTISGNNADNGGGVHNEYGELSLVSSTVSGNTADSTGGGVNHGGYTYRGGARAASTVEGGGYANEISIQNSTISDNYGYYGGGVFAGDTAHLVHNTITNNESYYQGGGVLLGGEADVTLFHNIISGNYSEDYAHEIERFDSYTPYDALTRSADSFVSIMSQQAMTGTVTSYGNLIGSNTYSTADSADGVTLSSSDITATSDGDIPTALYDILNEALQDNGGPTKTHGLVFKSPAIDAATDVLCLLYADNIDQRGEMRPADGDDDDEATCDIGSFEFSAVERSTSTLRGNSAPNPLAREASSGGYAPVIFGATGVTIRDNGGADAGTVVVTRTNGASAAGVDYPLPFTLDIEADTNSALDVDLTICYTDEEFNSVTGGGDEAAMLLYRDSGAGFSVVNGATVDVDANCVTASNVDGFSQWALGAGVVTATTLSSMDAQTGTGLPIATLLGLASLSLSTLWASAKRLRDS